MPETVHTDIGKLRLDLSNFRTVPQKSEVEAIQAMISMSPDRFWGLMESLIDDNYLPTENIIVLKVKNGEGMIVKEGNRRVAVLKLIHGDLQSDDIIPPDHLLAKIKGLGPEWRKNNRKIPCAIYHYNDAGMVDRIVTLAHGKGEKASKDQWNAVARARHNRDANKASEPALDLLEKYIAKADNISGQLKALWAADFPLSVLAEVIQKIAVRFNVKNAADFAEKYPALPKRKAIDDIIRDVGNKIVRFDTIRKNQTDFFVKYGLPPLPAEESDSDPNKQGGQSKPTRNGSGDATETKEGAGTVQRKTAAVSIQDPRSVARALKNFTPMGNKREKVVTLRDEARSLKLNKNPLAFCFVLRSMFEISAKAYCEDHKNQGGPSVVKSDGSDRKLVEVLRDITSHITKNKKDKVVTKELHGAMTELATSEGLLSVTSMNQLVHNPSFSVTETDICKLFGNVFPLLEAMNR
jgi:hypothetical protein